MPKDWPAGTGRIAFWLIPAEPWLGRLNALISSIAERQGGPGFVAHVTVYVDEDPWPEGLGEFLGRVAGTGEPIMLGTGAVVGEPVYTRALFLRLERSAAIEDLSLCLREGSRSGAAFHLDPHLSLLYGNLSGDDVEALRASLPELPREIGFDALAAVWIPPGPVLGKEDVERWVLRERVSLGKGNP